MHAADAAVDILGLTFAEFASAALAHGVKRPRALDAYRAVFRQGAATLPWIAIRRPPLTAQQLDGETIKFCLRHDDGLETESVLIPMHGRSGAMTRTLCVSSQVGCAMGCRFCETAQMGLVKNLVAADIVAQWFAATHELGERPKNLVFMGMGEPMDNLDEVLQSLRVLCDHDGAAMAASNISVSTVGRVEGIRRYGEFVRQRGFHRANLAVSLNAPNDEIRSAIMPINRKHPMAELREAMLAFPLRPKAAICVEYVLIPGVNDRMEHCDELCAYLKGIRCSLNVIPYNPRRESPWPAPTEDEVTAFLERAIANGQFVKRRQTKGRSVMGACGQLGNPQVRRRKWVDVSVGGEVRES
ncbi:MAG: 23S rRNA (adenine(2503)-C(2))-methyltransferase RlmN [Phycisphaerales bacterium]